MLDFVRHPASNWWDADSNMSVPGLGTQSGQTKTPRVPDLLRQTRAIRFPKENSFHEKHQQKPHPDNTARDGISGYRRHCRDCGKVTSWWGGEDASYPKDGVAPCGTVGLGGSVNDREATATITIE